MRLSAHRRKTTLLAQTHQTAQKEESQALLQGHPEVSKEGLQEEEIGFRREINTVLFSYFLKDG